MNMVSTRCPIFFDDLNETRKSESYGDIEAPELDAEDTATRIENYVEAVRKLLGGQ